MQEGAAAAGDDVHPLAELLAAVVAGGAGEDADAIALHGHVQRLEDLHPGRVRLQEGVDRVGDAQHHPVVLACLREVELLVEVHRAQWRSGPRGQAGARRSGQ